jgi:AcrR family transcriptional regulator
VARARRHAATDSATRTALLDAAQAIMVDEGYAAVTTRRLAAKVGVNSTLVYYYFETMDDLFIELFRRGAQRSLQRQADVLESPQPLRGLWELTHDLTSTALTNEFIALANHRKEIRSEIADYSRRFRRMQIERLSGVLEGYGFDPKDWPAAALILLMASASRFLLIEEAFDIDIGHAETVALIERLIDRFEGQAEVALPGSG